ncbi:MAG: hypothetical protein LC808_21875 [Actinobacteria bacterium]|nr:hypothetical protein [Actinomycetota bacterium]
MSHVNETRWRLLRERLGKTYRQAHDQELATLPEGLPPDPNVEILLRLTGAMLTLLEWHAINGKGRCRVRTCARRRWLPWRRHRTCPVFATVQFWMEQPLRIVQKAGGKW